MRTTHLHIHQYHSIPSSERLLTLQTLPRSNSPHFPPFPRLFPLLFHPHPSTMHASLTRARSSPFACVRTLLLPALLLLTLSQTFLILLLLRRPEPPPNATGTPPLQVNDLNSMRAPVVTTASKLHPVAQALRAFRKTSTSRNPPIKISSLSQEPVRKTSTATAAELVPTRSEIHPRADFNVPTSPLPCTPYTPCNPPVGVGARAALRSRNLDWHDLVPEDSNSESPSRLTQLELSLIHELQMLKGGRTLPDLGSGPLAQYSGCARFRSPCAIHASFRSCVRDQLCAYCNASSSCIDRLETMAPSLVTGARVPLCAGPLIIQAAPRFEGDACLQPLDENGVLGPRVADASSCRIVVSRNAHVRVTTGGNSRMAYHWYTETAGEVMRAINSVEGLQSLATHIWLESAGGDLNFILDAFTDSCVRRIPVLGSGVCYTCSRHPGEGPLKYWDAMTGQETPLPPSVALESVEQAVATGMRIGLQEAREMVKRLPDGWGIYVDGGRRWTADDALTSMDMGPTPPLQVALAAILGVTPAMPDPRSPVITLVSRRNKRLILNEDEVIAALKAAFPHARVVLAVLEDLNLYAQLLLFRRTSVLIAVHGSGLINTVHMLPDTAVIQIVPFGLQGAASFFEPPARAAGVRYLEWTNRDVTATRFHWHFIGPDFAARREDIAAGLLNSDCCGQDVYFSFWINQDTWVNTEELVAVTRQGLGDAAHPPVDMSAPARQTR